MDTSNHDPRDYRTTPRDRRLIERVDALEKDNASLRAMLGRRDKKIAALQRAVNRLLDMVENEVRSR